MESVSGKDLSTFFEQWLHRSSHPKIEGQAHIDKSEKKLSLHIRQIQQDAPYKLPLDIKIFYADGTSRIHQVNFYQSEQTFSFSTPGRPVRIELDPDCWLLIEASNINL